MPLTFKQEEQREAAAFLQQEEQSVAFLGKGAIPKTSKAKAKKAEKTEDSLADMFAEESQSQNPPKTKKTKKTAAKKIEEDALAETFLEKKQSVKEKEGDEIADMFAEFASATPQTNHTIRFTSLVSKASQKCEQLTTWNFQDIGFFLTGTVFIFCIFALIRNVAFSDCFQSTEIIRMPRMDEKVLNDFILEGVDKMLQSDRLEFVNENGPKVVFPSISLEHPIVANFVEGLKVLQQQLLELSEKVDPKTKITFKKEL